MKATKQSTAPESRSNVTPLPKAPKGRKMEGNLGPGKLRPGAGKQVQRTQQPLYCGSMAGRVTSFEEHPNAKRPESVSVRFGGEFLLVTANGKTMTGGECYLPGTLQRRLLSAQTMDREHWEPKGAQPGKTYNRGHFAGTLSFQIEVWCEPDEEGKAPSPLGYSYVTYDRNPQAENSPLMALAYEAGFLSRPKTALAGPEAAEAPEEAEEEVDPETGEVSAPDAPAGK